MPYVDHLLRWHSFSRSTSLARGITRAYYSTKTSKPLRILFCGSDEFSSRSLQALHQEQQRDPLGIKSIDVLCRPGKRVGRNLKVIREVPVKTVADELGLRVHQRDTFNGWDLPKPDGETINLIIAVSFGLFVPARILKSAEYGGLNVHPSLLPNLRGAAPLQWTIIKGLETTGVTLQTLDDKSFDHGKILLQTPPINLHQLGLHKPTYSILQDVVTTHAQKLLVQGIRERVFVPPIHDISSNANEKDLIFARKLKAKDAEIDWSNSSTQIAKQYRAMGPLWATMRRENGSTVRVKLDDIEEVPRSDMHTKGRLQIIGYSEKTLLSFSALKDGSIVLQRESKEIANQGTQAQEPDLRIGKMTLEAKSRVAARMAAEGLKVDDR